MVREVVLAEFNAWMVGAEEYCDLSPDGQAYVDEYLEGYERYIDAMCAVADA